MTIEELAEELQLSPLYLYKHWRRITKSYGNIGITRVKKGRGNSAQYGIKDYEDKEIRWVKKII